MTASLYTAPLAEWLALGLALVCARQLLMWVGLRGLRPTILHRMELPEGLRVRDPMRFGIVYTLAKWGGWLAAAYLIALIGHLVLLGFDRGWSAQGGIALASIVGIAATVLALDRLLAAKVRGVVGLPTDWHARAQ